jgi:two-component system, OmpR family, alkaline phosphatase synthesis response regulator PhoP
MDAKILFVEDEETMRVFLGDRLRSAGYSVEYSGNGVDALEKATSIPFDLIILDVMLPGMDGFELCERIRSAGIATPVVMLTARGQIDDKLTGFDRGADDYMTKPFDVRELLARIEVLIRRTAAIRPQAVVYEFGALRIDLLGTEVTLNGAPVAVSAREFQLLRYLIEHRGKTLSRETLLKEVWGYSADTFTRTVDVHIASLRNKLRSEGERSNLIQTVKGLGYKFAA